MHASKIFCNLAPSNKNNNSKTFRIMKAMTTKEFITSKRKRGNPLAQNQNNMKNETKKKIAAVSAGFTLATFVGTFILVTCEHPAQWYVGGACMFGMIITFVFSCSIED